MALQECGLNLNKVSNQEKRNGLVKRKETAYARKERALL